MSPFMQFVRLSSLVLAFWLLVAPARAQQPAAPQNSAPQDSAPQDSFLLTIFLKHDQSKTFDPINDHLKRKDYVKKFPPEWIEIVSSYIMMGIGQVVTLRVPSTRLREV